MDENVKRCINARVEFFDNYYTIPEDMKEEVDSFIEDINKLGSSCSDSTTFEQKFISEGLSDRFNSILPKCSPKSFKMTNEQKKQSWQTTKDIISDNKNEIIKDSLSSVGDRVFNKIKDDAIDKNRKKMIADGTFDDYSKATSIKSSGESILNFFKNKFK